MKTILFYDSETSGLPLWSQPSEHPDQPRVVQLAAELCIEATGETLQTMNMLVRPDGWEISEEAFAVHGISTERAMAEGLDEAAVIAHFIEMWKEANLRSGHNEPFDMRMVRIMLMRDPHYSGVTMPGPKGDISFADYWKQGVAFCTQSNSTKIVNTGRPPGDKKKTANLAEAYQFFTGQPLEGAHNAMVDVRAAKAVYYGIKQHLAAA